MNPERFSVHSLDKIGVDKKENVSYDSFTPTQDTLDNLIRTTHELTQGGYRLFGGLLCSQYTGPQDTTVTLAQRDILTKDSEDNYAVSIGLGVAKDKSNKNIMIGYQYKLYRDDAGKVLITKEVELVEINPTALSVSLKSNQRNQFTEAFGVSDGDTEESLGLSTVHRPEAEELLAILNGLFVDVA